MQRNIRHYFQKHKEWIETNVDSNTIVVTHHLPSFDLIHPKYKTKDIIYIIIVLFTYFDVY